MSDAGERASAMGLYSQLVGQLRQSHAPAQWWLARHQAIALLERDSPRLFEALTAHYRLITGRAAGT
jgi:hypothetical protein